MANCILKAIEAAVIFLLPANPLIAITLNPCSGYTSDNRNNGNISASRNEKIPQTKLNLLGILYINKVQKKTAKKVFPIRGRFIRFQWINSIEVRKNAFQTK